ncbi:hypothetical protein [Neotamlana laminarinivorans]|uniref:Uncharacterized protein n=1 Tax=Neotamlana laminarinivorans TaxID=2883124 RepID=A0A9X1I5C7_9FLAO|nr:hypothetical protein [Tamlana laminarinivorans]MCB4800289.1 hypothetical protein [Tamlana laminarinivorans]
MNTALSDKTKLINENVGHFNLDNDKWSIDNYLYTMNRNTIDSLTLVKLINKAIIKKSEKWEKGDLENTYLVKKDEILSIKKVLSELNNLDKQEIKTVKKQIRQFNNRSREWRSWPMSISKPIFSDDRLFCIVGFVFGNNGGHTELYKKTESKWERIAVFNRFAY